MMVLICSIAAAPLEYNILNLKLQNGILKDFSSIIYRCCYTRKDFI